MNDTFDEESEPSDEWKWPRIEDPFQFWRDRTAWFERMGKDWTREK